ncbi:MAG TPA: ABC transporter permease [Acidobacteriaceae bacterium]|jgi:predicted permease
MSRLGEFGRRIGMLLRRNQVANDLEDEMQLHLELRRQQQAEAGIAPSDAEAAARRRFGNPTLQRERSYTAWGWSWLEGLLQDILYGLRAMLRSPGITIVALLSLALGIGANTAIFSLMDAVMLRSLPVKEPGKLMLLGPGDVWGITSQFGRTEIYSYPFYRQMRERNQVFSDVAAFFSMHNDVHGSVEGRKAAEPMRVQLVSGTYFSTLGVQAARGRMLTDQDDHIEGGNPVAVVSDAWWKRSLARDSAVLDKRLKIGSTIFSIVGVAPPEFFGTKVGESPDIWIPLSMMKEVPPGWGSYTDNFSESLEIFGRLKPGVSVAQATTNVNLLFRQILRGFEGASPGQKDPEGLIWDHVQLTSMARGLSSLRAEFSNPLKILMAIVGLVLLIACANIANLLLARSTARAREFAVRQALGAQRARLVRQLLTESLMLAVAGGALGVALAAGAGRLLLRMVSDSAEAVPLDLSIDTRMLLFTAAITLATALLFGTIPAFRATRLELTRTLKDGQGAAGSRSRSPLARVLVVSQVAFSLVLVVGAGLFLRSLVNLSHVDTGFNKENVLRLQVDASSAGYKSDDPRLRSLYQQIEARVSALPGVHAASFSAFTFNEGAWNTSVFVAGYHTDQKNNVFHNVVGNGYFSTMQIPLLAGRTFGLQDTPTSRKVAVISERMARTLFPKGSPIGRHYGMGDPQNANYLEVIGIVKDVKSHSLQENNDTLDYLPASQRDGYMNDFEVRYTGDFGAIASEVQLAIHSIDRNLPISNVTTLDEQVARSITDQRVVAQLSTFFGLLAVFLSAIGIYGLMSYVVSRRTNEIGIRMALGAERMHVRWLVMREILVLVILGIAIGVPAALLASRFTAGLLYGLGANDPLSLLAAVAVMLGIAALAGYLPARRASRVDPMVALRYE